MTTPTLALFDPAQIVQMSASQKATARLTWLWLRRNTPGAAHFDQGDAVRTVNGVRGVVRQRCGNGVLVEYDDGRTAWISHKWVMREKQ